MVEYDIERRGGFTNLPAKARINDDSLDPADRAALADLVEGKKPLKSNPGADQYTYVVTRRGAKGRKSREVPEEHMPDAIARQVKEEF